MESRSPWERTINRSMTLKECEEQISMLIKENFSLKCRIYNQELESGIHRMNSLSESDDKTLVAALSSEAEQLKKELTHKHLLLWQSKQAIEYLEKSIEEHLNICHKNKVEVVEEGDSPISIQSLPELEEWERVGTSQVTEEQFDKMEINRLHQDLAIQDLKINQLELSLKIADRHNNEITLVKPESKVRPLTKENRLKSEVQNVRGIRSAPALSSTTIFNNKKPHVQTQPPLLDMEDQKKSADLGSNLKILDKYYHLTRETIPQFFTKMKEIKRENIKLKREIDRVNNGGDTSSENISLNASDVIRLYFGNYKNLSSSEEDQPPKQRDAQNELWWSTLSQLILKSEQ